MRKMLTLLQVLFYGLSIWDCTITEGRKGIGGSEQEWGHITVRPHVHMFWWLFFTTANVSNYAERPLVIWLQGGPGMPSTGYGNFVEIGPFDLDLQPRNSTWVKHCNVLFIDNPVDVGFSYFSETPMKFTETNEEIGRDLVSFMKRFLSMFKEFRTVPLYIFGESYGGKMAVEFAYQLHKKIRKGSVLANLQGIGLGGAYISPIDYIQLYAPITRNLGLLDRNGYDRIDGISKEVAKALQDGNHFLASILEGNLTKTLVDITHGLDIYNIDSKSSPRVLPKMLAYEDKTTSLMNDAVKKALNISEDLKWKYMNHEIYTVLVEELMKPATLQIERLLNDSEIKIIVYNGVFDLLVNTAGTAAWLENLRWKGQQEWNDALTEPLQVNMINEGYVKRVGKLVFYTILRAGHSVPLDNVIAMEEIIKKEVLKKYNTET